MNFTTEELLAALMGRQEIELIKCSTCSGTGTHFDAKGKPSVCKRCKGKRKIVLIPRFPAEEPYSDYWKAYFESKK